MTFLNYQKDSVTINILLLSEILNKNHYFQLPVRRVSLITIDNMFERAIVELKGLTNQDKTILRIIYKEHLLAIHQLEKKLLEKNIKIPFIMPTIKKLTSADNELKIPLIDSKTEHGVSKLLISKPLLDLVRSQRQVTSPVVHHKTTEEKTTRKQNIAVLFNNEDILEWKKKVVLPEILSSADIEYICLYVASLDCQILSTTVNRGIIRKFIYKLYSVNSLVINHSKVIAILHWEKYKLTSLLEEMQCIELTIDEFKASNDKFIRKKIIIDIISLITSSFLLLKNSKGLVAIMIDQDHHSYMIIVCPIGWSLTSQQGDQLSIIGPLKQRWRNGYD